MDKEFHISMVLDTRRAKIDGTYPVKLRVYTAYPRKQMLYPTIFSFTEKDFEKIWLTTKPRNENKDDRRKLQAVETKAIETAEQIIPFDFNQFENKLYRKVGDGQDVFYHYDLIIKSLTTKGQLGTASNYKLSLKSLKEFAAYKKGQIPKHLNFSEITGKWLNDYENYMTDEPKSKSLTTVSMYLRALRTVFNNAIQDKEIEREIYPFGKGTKKYQVPAVKSVKKALSKEQLKQLFEAIPNSEEQKKAKDFWFFSYSCNGMNIKDIALLKYQDLQDDTIVFYRAKTIKTAKSNLSPVTVYLTDYAKSIIELYGNENKSPQTFIFPIISKADSNEARHKAVKNFTKFINQNLKKLASKNGITSDISTYWARHSFATNAVRSGASMEFVSEALDHSSLKVTKGYFAGFEDKEKKKLMDTLMNFEV